MKPGWTVRTLQALLGLMAAVTAPAQGSQQDLLVGGGISVGRPVGRFADYVGGFRGMEGAARTRLGGGPVGLRAGFQYLDFPPTARVRTWGGGAVGPAVSITTGSRLFISGAYLHPSASRAELVSLTVGVSMAVGAR